MSYCIHCGVQLVDGARFCARCGTAVANAGSTATYVDEDMLHNLMKRAIYYAKIEDYGNAYEYCERVLDIDPDNEIMLDLKSDILLWQSDDVLRRADYLLETCPYDEIKDEVNRLIEKAGRIYPGNKKIEDTYDKVKGKIFDGLIEFVGRSLNEHDYKTANEMAALLMESWPGDSRAEWLYRYVKEHSPRKWR